MKGFLLGVLCTSLAFGAYLFWKDRQDAADDAPIARAGGGADAGAAPRTRRRKGRGAARRAEEGGGLAAAAPEPVRLSPADLRPVGQGDDLSRPDVVRLDLGEGGDGRELTQDEIDERFRAQEEAILSCIDAARPDPETYVPGRVTVKFRIQRAGTVRGVRVEAPAILQRGGLYDCVKRVVGGLRFPASGSSQIVTYPFTLG